jgi:four helix bundle protein
VLIFDGIMKSKDLESRLIDFAVTILGIVEKLTDSKAGNHIGGQLIRSGTSPAPNYGEAQSAESRKDFVHKMKISLKELRETMVWLKIIDRKKLATRDDVLKAISECNELIAIFVASTKTADANEKSFKNQKSTILAHQSNQQELSN